MTVFGSQVSVLEKSKPGAQRRTFAVCMSVAVDMVSVLLAFTMVFQAYVWSIRAGLHDQALPYGATPYVVIAFLFAFMVALVFWYLGLYAERAGLLNLWEIRTAMKGLILTAAFLFASLFFLNLHFSRLVVCGSIAIASVLVVLERRILSFVISERKISGRKGKRILIFGCGETGRLVMKKIVQAPHLGSTVVGFLDDATPEGSPVTCSLSQTGAAFIVPVFGGLEQLDKVVQNYGVDELLVTGPSATTERLFEIFEFARERNINVAVVPELAGVRIDQLRVDDLSAIPILRPYPMRASYWYGLTKRAFDIFASTGAAVITFPLWVITAVLVRLDSPGPVLFKQQRIGQNGKPFTIYKFRTMRPEADLYAPSPDSGADARITRTGRVLRATGLDELPQILNVFRGEMSLVGPRPEMEFMVQRYTPIERKRLEVKPGITGLWQISADRHTQIHENIEYDLYYLNHRSFLLDLLIVLETCFITLEIALMAVRNGTWVGRRELVAAVQRSTPVSTPITAYHPEPYVVMAIEMQDQSNPDAWRAWLPMVAAVSGRWPVRIPVQASEAPIVDDVIRQSRHQLEIRGTRVSCVPYADRSELRALVNGAEMVVTDMKSVQETAVRSGIDTLVVVDGRMARRARAKAGKGSTRRVHGFSPPAKRAGY